MAVRQPLVAMVFGLVLALSASSATAADTGQAKAAYGPGGCSDWGQTAVRNWMSGKCPAPGGVTTYTHRYTGDGGITVRGLRYGDGCTKSADRPRNGKFDFRPACDMHDYGFWLMQNGGYLKKSQANVNEINSWFGTVLRYGACGEYRGPARDDCQRLAKAYEYGVAAFAVWFAAETR